MEDHGTLGDTGTQRAAHTVAGVAAAFPDHGLRGMGIEDHYAGLLVWLLLAAQAGRALHIATVRSPAAVGGSAQVFSRFTRGDCLAVAVAVHDSPWRGRRSQMTIPTYLYIYIDDTYIYIYMYNIIIYIYIYVY